MNELCLSILEFILRSFFCYKNKEMIYLSFFSFPLHSFAFYLIKLWSDNEKSKEHISRLLMNLDSNTENIMTLTNENIELTESVNYLKQKLQEKSEENEKYVS